MSSRLLGLLICLFILSACNRERNNDSREHAEQEAVEKTEIRIIDTRQPKSRKSAQMPLSARKEAAAGAVPTTATAEQTTTSETGKAGGLFIRGRVLNEGGGPVPHAELALFSKATLGDRVPVELTAGGNFSVPVEPGGPYQLKASAKGYAPAVSEELLVFSQSVEGLKLTLGPGRSLAGRVVEEDGTPVGSATISIMPAAQGVFSTVIFEPSLPTHDLRFLGRGESGPDGHFRIEQLPTGIQLDVAAEKDGFAHPAYHRLGAETSNTTELTLVLPPSGTVYGQVTDANAEPLIGAKVTLSIRNNLTSWREEVDTETSGVFTIYPAPIQTSGTVSVELDGYNDYRKDVTLGSPLNVTLSREERCTVTVSCLDMKSMELITSATVRAMTKDMPRPLVLVQELEPGKFQMSVPKKQDVSVFGEAEDYGTTFRELMTTGENEQEMELLFRKPSVVKGRVVEKESKKPVASARIVTRFGKTEKAKSQANGHFEMEVSDTHQTYWAETADGRRSKEFSPAIPYGATVEVGDIELLDSRPVTIKVVRANTKSPVRGAQVQVQLSARGVTDAPAGVTDYEGEFKTTLPAEESASVKLPEWETTRQIEASDSAGDMVVVIPVGEGVFRGRLLWNDEPVAGTVSGHHMQLAGQRSVSASTGSDGKFEFKHLAPGKWAFGGLAQKKELGTRQVEIEIPASEGAVEEDINLAGHSSRVKGRVVNEQDEPVAKARVAITTTNANGGVETDENGNFETWPIDPENCVLQALHDVEGRSDIFQVPAPAPDQLIEPVTLVIRKGTAQVTFTVLSILDGLRIDGSSVELQQDGKSYAAANSVVGASSDLIINDVVPGQYRAIIRASGYSTVERDITLEAGESREFTDVLSPAASLTVNVADSTGYIASGATVTLVPLDQDSMQPVRTQTADKRGSAGFQSILYGNYQVEATGPSGAASATISTHNQRSPTVHLVLKPVQ